MSTITATHVLPAARPDVRRRPQPVASATARSTVRLTRRGRLVVFLAGLLVVLAAAVALGATSVATDRPEQTQVIMVGPGDTLWSIARAASTDGNTGAMVDHLEQLNHLDSAALQVGQRLRVPVNNGS